MMENLIEQMRREFRVMLDLSREIGGLNERSLKHNETTNIKYYNPELCDLLIQKVNEKQDLLSDLEYKWLGPKGRFEK